MKHFFTKVFSILIILFCFSLDSYSFAQQRIITGSVVDAASKEPLPGVGVAIKDSNTGTSTDISGNFSISVENGDVLVFSFIGFLNQEVTVTSSINTLNITLTENASALDEVVVVGYGTQRRSDVTGSIVSVKAEDMVSVPTRSVAEMLRGKAPGLQVTTDSARPGGGSNILIRGRRSLSGGNGPLYVVDNVPVDATTANDINAADIESVEVLKDASSQAIYGARAANGVILITTKRGTEGRVAVNYNAYTGVQQLKKNFDLYSGEEWADLRREAFRSERADGEYEDDIVVFDQTMREVLESGEFVDWQDFMIQDAWMQKHDISVRGGNDKTRISVSLGYMDQNGMVEGSGFERGTARVNLDQKISDRINIGANLNFTRNYQSNEDGNLNEYIITTPLSKPFDDEGNLQLFITEENTTNPKFLNRETLNETRNNRLLLNFFGSVNLFEGLTYRLNTNVNTRSVEGGTYRTKLYQKGSNIGNAATISSSNYTDYLIENILTYDKELSADHRFDATLMQSVYEETLKSFSLSGSQLPNDLLGYNGIAAAQVLDAPSRGYTDRSLLSYMGRVRYTLKDKYLFNFTARVDGSSVFGVNNKYGFFPSASVAWRLEQEKFIQNIDWVSQLKLRVNYGSVGNQAVSPYTTLGEVSQYPILFGDGSYQVGYLPNNQLSNPNLKWETTTSLNVGVDYGFLQGRISGSLEYYESDTKDLLVSRSINESLGYTSMLDNIGQVNNKGFEFLLNTIPVQTKDFTWGVDVNFSTNKNTLVKLDGSLDDEGNPVDDIGNNWFIGEPIDVYYNYVFDGIWQLGDDIANSHMPDAKPGDIRIRDLNRDNLIDSENDRQIIYRNPDWIGSLGTTLAYKNFDFLVDFYMVQGAVRSNPYLYDFNSGGSLSGKNNGIKVNYWTPENPSNEFPRPKHNSSTLYFSSLGYQDASYIRLRTATIGYTLPTSVTNKLGISKLRVYTTANNLFTKTDYLSYSPEVTPGGYPEPKVFMFGLNVSL